MTERRFMINSRNIRGGYASLGGDIFNHVVRVLRLGTGDNVLLTDEQGNEHRGMIDQVSKEWATVKIGATSQPEAPATDTPRITICQALPKGEKIDLILQKGTELGVHDFVLFGGARSVARIRENQRDARLERWGRIVSGAARQCGRTTVPEVRWCASAAEALASADRELRLLLWEEERRQGLKQILAGLSRPSSVVVAVGPEGGFDPREVELFQQNGYLPVSLGSRILRTETAAMAVTAILQYLWDNL
jgi:16S rRNA (uracil1498-N3)-methyltransferase